MDIHAKSVDVDMDMDGEFHIHGNPGDTIGCSLSQQQQSQVSTNNLAIGRNVTVTMLRGREVDVHGWLAAVTESIQTRPRLPPMRLADAAFAHSSNTELATASREVDKSSTESFGKSASLPLTAENALAWIIDTRPEVAHSSVECIEYWAAFE